jgi:hypothetical protein
LKSVILLWEVKSSVANVNLLKMDCYLHENSIYGEWIFDLIGIGFKSGTRSLVDRLNGENNLAFWRMRKLLSCWKTFALNQSLDLQVLEIWIWCLISLKWIISVLGWVNCVLNGICFTCLCFHQEIYDRSNDRLCTVCEWIF